MMEPRDLFRSFIRSAAISFAACLVIVLSSANLWAGPPYLTDDPDTIDYRHWEFYLASQQTWEQGEGTGTAPHLEVNYGIVPDVMLHLISPLSFSKSEGKPATYGFGDMELGVMIRFFRETDDRPQIGTFPHLEVPTGSRSRGLGNGQPQVFLPLWIKKSWGPWTSFGGGGYWINPGPGQKNYWYFGGVVQREMSSRIALGGELFATTPQAVGESGQSGFNLAAIVSLGGGHQIMLSAGRDILGPDTLFFYVAYYLTIGPRD